MFSGRWKGQKDERGVRVEIRTISSISLSTNGPREVSLFLRTLASRSGTYATRDERVLRMLGTGKLMRTVPNTTKSSHGRDGAIVLDIKHGRMFNLNPVGSRILELLKCGSDECEIIDRVCSEFGTPRDVVESDLHDFLLELENQRIIERNDPDAQAQEES